MSLGANEAASPDGVSLELGGPPRPSDMRDAAIKTETNAADHSPECGVGRSGGRVATGRATTYCVSWAGRASCELVGCCSARLGHTKSMYQEVLISSVPDLLTRVWTAFDLGSRTMIGRAIAAIRTNPTSHYQRKEKKTVDDILAADQVW